VPSTQHAFVRAEMGKHFAYVKATCCILSRECKLCFGGIQVPQLNNPLVPPKCLDLMFNPKLR
jgi:hypothetical protein